MRSARLDAVGEEDLREGIGGPAQVVQRRRRREHAGRRDVGADEGVDEGALAGVELADDGESNGARSLGRQVADPRGGREVAHGVGVVVEAREELWPRGGCAGRGIHVRATSSAIAAAHGARRGCATAAIASRVVRGSRDVGEPRGRSARPASASERVDERRPPSPGASRAPTSSASASRSSMAASSSGRGRARSPPITASRSARRAASRAPSALANAARHRASPCSPLASTTDRTRVRVCASLGTYASADDSASLAPGVSSTIARRSGTNARRVAEHRERPTPDKRGAPVGRRRLRALERGLRALGVAAKQPGLGAAHGDVRRALRGRSRGARQAVARTEGRGALDPQLCARGVALSEIEVGEADERVDAGVAARLRDREGADERVAHLVGRAPGRLARACEAHPDLGARRRAARELLEGQGQLGVEVRHLAGVGEEREPERRVRRLREDPVRGRARRHPVAGGEGLLPDAQILVRAREHDLDLAKEGRDDVGEAHGSPA